MNTVMIAPSGGQEVEVLAKAKRRRFALEYKRRILREADRCRKPGELGVLQRSIREKQSVFGACI